MYIREEIGITILKIRRQKTLEIKLGARNLLHIYY